MAIIWIILLVVVVWPIALVTAVVWVLLQVRNEIAFLDDKERKLLH